MKRSFGIILLSAFLLAGGCSKKTSVQNPADVKQEVQLTFGNESMEVRIYDFFTQADQTFFHYSLTNLSDKTLYDKNMNEVAPQKSFDSMATYHEDPQSGFCNRSFALYNSTDTTIENAYTFICVDFTIDPDTKKIKDLKEIENTINGSKEQAESVDTD